MRRLGEVDDFDMLIIKEQEEICLVDFEAKKKSKRAKPAPSLSTKNGFQEKNGID